MSNVSNAQAGPSGSTRPANKIETKYNVTTDFPDLGLHSAAVSGNVGLALYALTHGQPENSVLHGLLPLHAACSGGSEPVVRMLIDRGADVNAPRLPRRYSNDSKKAPSVGVSGSGPLHFAAANGHHQIVKLLLARGARHDKKDKHGLLPEDLALANGHEEVVQTLKAWGTLRASLKERDGAVFEEEEGEGGGEGEGEQARDGEMEKEKRRRESNGSDVPEEVIQAEEVVTGKRKTSLSSSLSSFVHRNRKGSSSSTSSIPTSPSTLDASASKRSNSTSGTLYSRLSKLSTHSNSNLDPSDSSLSVDLNNSPTSSSDNPNVRRLATDPPPLPLSQSTSSVSEPKRRRPSLPSILERSAHMIAHPVASHQYSKHQKQTHNIPTYPAPPPVISQPISRSNTYNTMAESESGSIASSRRKFTSNRSLLKLFSRDSRTSSRFDDDDESNSPPSASPSPPSSALEILPLDEEDLDRTIEALRRQSFDGQLVRGGSLDLERNKSDRSISASFSSTPSSPTRRSRTLPRQYPPSAPVSKTSFFPSSPNRPTSSRGLSPRSFSHSSPTSPDLSENSAGPSLWYRPRNGSEPACPSPLGLGEPSSRRSKRGGGSRISVGESSRSTGSGGQEYSDEEDSSAFSITSSPYYNPNRPPSFTPWTSSSGTRSPSYTGYTTSTAVPPPSTSSINSNISSLRKVASANLRRESESTAVGDGDAYDGRSKSWEQGEMGDGSDDWENRGGYDQRNSTASSFSINSYNPYLGYPSQQSSSSTRPNGLLPSASMRSARSRGASFTSTLSSTYSSSPHASPSGSQPVDADALTLPELALGPSILISPTSPPSRPTTGGGGRSRSSSVNSNASGRGGSTGGSAAGNSYASSDRLSSGARTSSGIPSIPSVPEDPSPSSSMHHLPRSTSPNLDEPASSSASPSPSSSSFLPQRRVSSRAEAADLVRKAEQEILSTSLASSKNGNDPSALGGSGSTLSLSAQLAAYGEKLAIERSFAEQDEREKKERAVSLAAASEVASGRTTTEDGGKRRRRARTSSDGQMEKEKEREKRGSVYAGKGDGKAWDSEMEVGRSIAMGLSPTAASDKAASSRKGGFGKHERERSGSAPSQRAPVPKPLVTVQAPPFSLPSSKVTQIYEKRSKALEKVSQNITSAIQASSARDNLGVSSTPPSSAPFGLSTQTSAVGGGSNGVAGGGGGKSGFWVVSGRHASASVGAPHGAKAVEHQQSRGRRASETLLGPSTSSASASLKGSSRLGSPTPTFHTAPSSPIQTSSPSPIPEPLTLTLDPPHFPSSSHHHLRASPSSPSSASSNTISPHTTPLALKKPKPLPSPRNQHPPPSFSSSTSHASSSSTSTTTTTNTTPTTLTPSSQYPRNPYIPRVQVIEGSSSDLGALPSVLGPGGAARDGSGGNGVGPTSLSDSSPSASTGGASHGKKPSGNGFFPRFFGKKHHS